MIAKFTLINQSKIIRVDDDCLTVIQPGSHGNLERVVGKKKIKKSRIARIRRRRFTISCFHYV